MVPNIEFGLSKIDKKLAYEWAKIRQNTKQSIKLIVIEIERKKNANKT